jgi:hypothetical protein
MYTILLCKEQIMKNSDWLPSKRDEQLAMAKNWIAVLTGKGSNWGIQDAETSELSELAEDAEKALAKAMSAERTAVVTAQCKEAYDKPIAFMRNLKARRFLPRRFPARTLSALA